ncbi:ribonuclease H family protein [Clostridium sp. MSJ-4]|uniref:ribonuclease H n=1 Tax=Clostridium simiarum TaxID=2841506 RepID=A0ABS6F308_9CLOT|nr:ribonuclease H family protein [Clostridium simiarum]MBU5592892.1 ribonuclease H family protein [Clostridium simiarum]
MGKKVYAIKEGYDSLNKEEVRDIIVETWDQCLKYVKGVKGAKYKSFSSLKEAEDFLKEENRLLKKGIDNYPTDVPQIYVDGSFNSSTGIYGYGLVVIMKDEIIYAEKGCPEDDSLKNLRQIAGELKGAIRAAEYALDYGYNHIVIFHDYEGISHHATGYWERKEKSSEEYYDKMNRFMKDMGLKITFVKVDSHTLDLYNEVADELAKLAAGVEIEGVVSKLLKNTTIKIKDKKVLAEIEGLIKETVKENIHVTSDIKKTNNIEKIKEENLCFIMEKLKEAYAKSECDAREYLKSLKDEIKEDIIISCIENK